MPLPTPLLVPWKDRPWPALPLPPLTPCGGAGHHDFSRVDPDTLCRCWHCSQLSPRSRARIEQRAAAAAQAREGIVAEHEAHGDRWESEP